MPYIVGREAVDTASCCAPLEADSMPAGLRCLRTTIRRYFGRKTLLLVGERQFGVRQTCKMYRRPPSRTPSTIQRHHFFNVSPSSVVMSISTSRYLLFVRLFKPELYGPRLFITVENP